ncbi:Uncharacterized protein OBRU01_04191 [Operophtera brumata]|uniref:Peptidase S1 domain-containing protein n=1 Tax=Operophtera brumata TaxID=104452 RepID=A0A0L7LQD7_OPEBR|nr:Uncharacterized protein OBRU01_04191 [Operophtera brumata]
MIRKKGWNTRQLRIVGGDEAPSRFGLFHVSLQNLSGDHVCGGAVVSRWHIVTAAHCLYGAEPDYIKVLVGTTNLNKGGIKHDTASISIHGDFNFSARLNDIGLLRVQKPFDLNHVRVIGLHETNLVEGDIVFLSGFGAQKVNGTSSTQMHVLTLPVFSQETCKYAMRYTREVADCMFCTFTKIGQGTCSDDKLVGLVSWGIPCARGFPDVHARITPFFKWIRSEIRNDICGRK